MAIAPPNRSTSLYPILADSRLGNTSVLARPATFDPGALLLPTTRSTAASACNSPSAFSSGARARKISMASTTLSTIGPRPLPLVDKLSSATTGSTPISARVLSAVAIAISAISLALGSITTAQSANAINPLCPSERSSSAMMKTLETSRARGCTPTPCIAARTVSAVLLTAPPTLQAASPAPTISEAKDSGFFATAAASLYVHPFARQSCRRRQYAGVRPFGKRDRLFQRAGPFDEPGHEELCRFGNSCHLPESRSEERRVGKE